MEAPASTDAPEGVPLVGGDEPAPQADRAKDEAEWRKRMAEARDKLQQLQMFADALQSQVSGLWTDFVNRDDPAQRALIEQKRNTALAELDRVKKQVEDQRKAIADLEEEARRAGVPAGWLR